MTDLHEKMPKSVKVGSYTFRMFFVPTGHEALNGENWGLTDLEKNQIAFDDSCPLARLANSVLHEIQHAINHSYGLDDRPKEEAIATQTANGWMQVYLDNPKLEMWLHKVWRELRKTR